MSAISLCGRLALACLLTLAWIRPAPTLASPLTLQHALQRSLQANPQLMAFSPLLAAQDARQQQAGLRPNPQLTLDADNVLGTGALGGSSGAELSLSLSQLIELGDLRERRVATASLARSGLEVDAHIARLDAVALTARRFVSLAAQQEQHQLTHQAVALAERTAAAVERRVTAAKGSVSV